MANKKTTTVTVDKNISTIDYVINNKPVEIKIKHTLTMAEMIGYVEEVSDSCFDETTGEYEPQLFDVTKRFADITFYTDLEVPSTDTPEKIEEMYAFMYSDEITGLLALLYTYINPSQYEHMDNAIQKKIEHRLRTDENTALQKLNELIQKLDSVTREMANAGEQLFGNLSSEQLSKITEAFLNVDGIDEKKIAEAVLDIQEKKKDEQGQV